MVFRREVVEAVGPFDARLGAGTPYRCEDVDYVARVSHAGFLGAHVPEVVVYHHHGRKAGPALEELKRANDFARGAFYMKRLFARDWKYVGGWLRVTWRHRDYKLSKELAGAWSYWLACRRGPI